MTKPVEGRLFPLFIPATGFYNHRETPSRYLTVQSGIRRFSYPITQGCRRQPFSKKRTMQQNPVGWFEIYVSDMARARAFYETVLSIELENMSMEGVEMWGFPGD